MNKLIALTLLFLSACGNFVETKTGGEKSKVEFDEASLNFEAVRAAVFFPRCVECHSQYNTFAGVKNEIGTIMTSVAANRMPQTGGPLETNLKSLLEAWVAAGAPERSGDGNTPLPPVVLEPTWLSVSQNIFQPRCTACHNPAGQARFRDLSSRAAIFTARDELSGGGQKLIDFENPEESYLLNVIQDPEEPMPPISSNIRRLNAEEIAVLKEWIRQGLP